MAWSLFPLTQCMDCMLFFRYAMLIAGRTKLEGGAWWRRVPSRCVGLSGRWRIPEQLGWWTSWRVFGWFEEGLDRICEFENLLILILILLQWCGLSGTCFIFETWLLLRRYVNSFCTASRCLSSGTQTKRLSSRFYMILAVMVIAKMH